MDGLIVILAILGLISSISKKKKARRQQQWERARQAGYDEVSAVPPPLMREDAPADKPAKPKAAAAQQVKIPFTKEEWAAFLSDHSEKQPVRSAKPVPADAAEAQSSKENSAEGRKFQTLAAQQLNAERLRPDERHLEGESHQEHAAHRQRIAEEEARLHHEREELKELRNVNLKKLRSAVVMSEVLGKPVALRGRR